MYKSCFTDTITTWNIVLKMIDCKQRKIVCNLNIIIFPFCTLTCCDEGHLN